MAHQVISCIEQEKYTERNRETLNSNVLACDNEYMYANGLDPISVAMDEMQETQDLMQELQLTSEFQTELQRVALDTNTGAFKARFLTEDVCKMVIIAYQRSIAGNSVL